MSAERRFQTIPWSNMASAKIFERMTEPERAITFRGTFAGERWLAEPTGNRSSASSAANTALPASDPGRFAVAFITKELGRRWPCDRQDSRMPFGIRVPGPC